jgi:hypothetical protein
MTGVGPGVVRGAGAGRVLGPGALYVPLGTRLTVSPPGVLRLPAIAYRNLGRTICPPYGQVGVWT